MQLKYNELATYLAFPLGSPHGAIIVTIHAVVLLMIIIVVAVVQLIEGRLRGQFLAVCPMWADLLPIRSHYTFFLLLLIFLLSCQ